MVVGEEEGALEGRIEGLPEGIVVGETVGVSVGFPVGAIEGSVVGAALKGVMTIQLLTLEEDFISTASIVPAQSVLSAHGMLSKQVNREF